MTSWGMSLRPPLQRGTNAVFQPAVQFLRRIGGRTRTSKKTQHCSLLLGRLKVGTLLVIQLIAT